MTEQVKKEFDCVSFTRQAREELDNEFERRIDEFTSILDFIKSQGEDLPTEIRSFRDNALKGQALRETKALLS